MITLGEKADELNRLKQEKARLNKVVKDVLNPKIFDLEQRVAEDLKIMGVEKFSTQEVAITMTSDYIPEVEDWDALYDYIVENNAPYILWRRPTLGPIREIWAAGQDVPGVKKLPNTTVATKTLG